MLYHGHHSRLMSDLAIFYNEKGSLVLLLKMHFLNFNLGPVPLLIYRRVMSYESTDEQLGVRFWKKLLLSTMMLVVVIKIYEKMNDSTFF